MRRADRELDFPSILSLLERCRVCRLAMVDNGEPYIVPMSYGYEERSGSITLYFHSAHEGRKLDILRRNSCICFEMDADYRLQEAETACKYSNLYSSVIGTGTVEFLSGEKKKHGLSVVMLQQSGKRFTFTDEEIEKVEVFAVRVKQISGKAKKM